MTASVARRPRLITSAMLAKVNVSGEFAHKIDVTPLARWAAA
jgi:hypothetical protein